MNFSLVGIRDSFFTLLFGARTLKRDAFGSALFIYVLSSCVTIFGGIIDGVIIGMYGGVDSLAAFGLTNPLFFSYALFGSILYAGSRPFCLRLLGKGKVDESRQIFSKSFFACLTVSFAAMAIILFFADELAIFLGASGEAAYLFDKARDYLIGITFGLPAISLAKFLSSYMQVDNDKSSAVLSAFAMVLVGTAGDLFVYLYLGENLFYLGLFTAISYYAELFVLLLHFRKKDILFDFTLKNLRKHSLKSVISAGLVKGLGRFAKTLKIIALNHVLAASFDAALAAYTCQRSVHEFLYGAMIGAGDALAILVGLYYGLNDRQGVYASCKTALRYLAVITIFISVVLFIFAPSVAKMFLANDEVALEMAIEALRFYCLGFPLACLLELYLGYLTSIGAKLSSRFAAFMLHAGGELLAVVPFVYVLGPSGVWISFGVAMLFALITSFAYSYRQGRRYPGAVDKILLLPKEFGYSSENCLEEDLHNMSEVMAFVDKAGDFCRKRGCDLRRAYFLSVAVEELAGNVIEHGFVDGKAHSLHVQTVKSDDDYILYISDDCPRFDPTRMKDLFNPKHNDKNIGIYLSVYFAKETMYTYALNMNHFIIKF